jgi:hypothetical protein
LWFHRLTKRPTRRRHRMCSHLHEPVPCRRRCRLGQHTRRVGYASATTQRNLPSIHRRSGHSGRRQPID